MITPEFCRTMARYNAWQNQSLIAAAETLSDADRKADRGSFFGSIAGTFNHLLWGDTVWMSRFDGWEAPDVGIPMSPEFSADWGAFVAARQAADGRILDWAAALGARDLDGDLAWFSGALQAEVCKPKWVCVQHFFNHQTHHRGQIHGMLTAARALPGDTDLFIMPEDV